MTRVERIGDATLMLGDCRDFIRGEQWVVDHVITDPPYEAEAHTPMRRTQASIKTGVAASLDFDAITEDMRGWIAAQSVAACRGWAMFFCQAEAVGSWRDALEAGGGKYKRAMIWVKPDSSPQFNGQMPAMGYESITLTWCGIGHARWNGGGRRGVFTHCVNTDRHGGHPTEKPLPLMRDLVSLFSDPGQTILDPFMGSETTGVACIQMGRKFTGMEINPAYFDIACRRIEAATREPRLDLEPRVKPKQEAMTLTQTPKLAPSASVAPAASRHTRAGRRQAQQEGA